MTVEFLPGEGGPDPSAEAERGAGRRPWRRFVAAAVVCLAALGWWAATRPTVGPATRPSAQPVHHAAHQPAPECRGLPDCSVHLGVPAALARLAREYLPAGARVRVRTVIEVDSLTHRDLLVARDVDAALGSVSVHIRVQRGGPATRAIVADPLGVGSLLLHRINSGFVVRLQYLAPDDVPPMLSRLQALIGDPRLAAA